MTEFQFKEIFPLQDDTTEYRFLTKEGIALDSLEDNQILKIAPEILTHLSEQAFKDMAHFLRGSHLKRVAAIFEDAGASENDRFVAMEMIKNAVIAAEGEFPLCQDTGTAIVIGKKGHQVWTDGTDEEALSRGVFDAYQHNNLRYSQNAPLSMFEEVNTATNLPAQIELYATRGDAYQFLFIAKGGGSANKTYLFQETKALLNPDALLAFMTSKMKALGTAACPPYHLAFVVGGLSAEMNLKTVKLATAKYLDGLPTSGDETGHAFRDKELEEQLLQTSRALGIGAQFGGAHFCLDTRVIRLPRHGASCPVGIGVSCSADRNIKAKITRKGVFLEKLETDPIRYLPEKTFSEKGVVDIDLDQPMDSIRSVLTRYPVKTPLRLSGKIIVARDMAHAKLKQRIDSEGDLPRYFKDHIIYYAGPAKTPKGYPSGSFGPTTAARMDPYVPVFQKLGGSLVMLAKGNRSKVVTESCRQYGGFYLGSIGGPAARLAKECITAMEVLEYGELGMEAIFRITVKDFPAFILIDDKGNDFFEGLL
jgi:fumarate hydratase class I